MGVKGGPTFNSFIIEKGSNKYSRVGFQLGLLAQIEVTDCIYLQPELLFITKGTEAKIDNRITTNTYEIFLNYLSVPISFCYTLKPLHIRGGAYFSYLVGSQAERYNEITNAFQNISRDNLSTTDIGYTFGIGYQYKNIIISGGYSQGLTKIITAEASQERLGATHNKTWDVSIAFLLI